MNNQAAQTMPEPVTASMCPSSDYAKGWNDCLAAMLAAAPSAASVSERARSLLADAFRDHGYPRAAESLEAGFTDSLDECALAAVEQALTQQRGEVAWKHDAESWGNALNEAAWVFVEQCPEKSALLFNNTKAPLRAAILKYAELVGAATTPQPSADAVREYVTELRAQANQKIVMAGACVYDGDRAHYKSAAQLLRRVADELESLLSAASDHQQNDAQGGGEA